MGIRPDRWAQGERERATECAKGLRQHAFICDLLAGDEVPEPLYGIGRNKRRYGISMQPSFDALLDRLEHRGFTVLVRDVPRQYGGHNRFYTLRRTRDVSDGDPLVREMAAREDQYARMRA